MADTESPAGRRRRSWFDNGVPVKFEIAVEKPAASERPAEVDEEMEVLELTHFTNPPRIDFGKLRTGRLKTRHLLVRNPHDYDQQVIIEKFPYKKAFSIDQEAFSVASGEELILTLTWQPTEAKYCREMVLFHVDKVYRLQAILFGSAEEPPKPKKKRPGLGMGRGTMAKKKPFSEISPNTNGNPSRLRAGKKTGSSAVGRENLPRRSAPVSRRSPPGRKTSPKGRKSSPKNRRSGPKSPVLVKTENVYDDDDDDIENEVPHYQGAAADGSHGYRPAANVRLVPDDPALPESPARRTTFIKKTSSSSSTSVKSTVISSTVTVTGTALKEAAFGSRNSCSNQSLQRETLLKSSVLTACSHLLKQNTRSTTVLSSNSNNHRFQKDMAEGLAKRKTVFLTHTVAFPGEEDVPTSEESVDDVGEAYAYNPSNLQLRSRVDLVKDDPAIPESPGRRTTFLKDDPTMPLTPVRRTTFQKDDPTMPLTPVRRTTFQKDDPTMPLTPVRRTTFQKDDPSMPLTPVRRMTYQKDAPVLPNTPVIEVDSFSFRSKSASPPRVSGQPVRFADDTSADLLDTPTSALIRQGTYTKLNGSLSPHPHRLYFNPTSPQILEAGESSGSCSDDLDLTRDSLEKMEQKYLLEEGDSLHMAVKPLEASVSDLQSPESVTSDLKSPESVTSDLKFPESVTSDLKSPESVTSDLKSPPMTLDELQTEARLPPGVSQESSPTDSEYITPLSTKYATPCGGSPGEEDTFNMSLGIGQLGLTAYFLDESQRRETLVSIVSEKLSHLSVSEDFGNGDATGNSVLLTPTVMMGEAHKNVYGGGEELAPRLEAAEDADEDVKQNKEDQDQKEDLVEGQHQTEDLQIPSPTAVESLFETTNGGSSTFDKTDSSVLSANVTAPSEDLPDVDSAPHSDADSPTSVLMNESFGGHKGMIDKLETVKEQLQHRLSSTPIANPLLAQRGFSSLNPTALSPIIGQRVDQETVVKSKAPPRDEDSGIRKQSRKELFAEPNERRLSNATVTKQNFDIKLDPTTKPQALFPEVLPNHRQLSTQTITKSKPVVCTRDDSKTSSKKLFVPNDVSNSKAKKPPVAANTRRSMPAPVSKVPRGRPSSLLPPSNMTRARSVSGGLPLLVALDDPKKRCHSTERVHNRLSSNGREVKKVKKSVIVSSSGNASNLSVGSNASKGDASSMSVSGRQGNRTLQLRRSAALSAMNKSAPLSKTRQLSGSLNRSKCLAQSKLVLIKNTSLNSVPALPKHPMLFAAKNMYYDERWLEKEERGFVQWLNFVLTPPDEYVEAKKPRVDAGLLSVDQSFKPNATLAPTKEVLSFRAYAARRRLNRLRRKACSLFQSEPIVRIYQKLEIEIESRHLAVRRDRQLHADLGIKQKVLEMILSYNPLWLRVGLETIFGEMLMLQSNTDVYGLSHFIVTRLLGNPDIARQYAHPTVPHLYRDGYDEALSQYTLKKFLLLVLFLDMAKVNRIIDHDPCLFCKDSDYKASRDLLLTFSKDHLSGEGDLTRHLGYLGYGVKHVQTALEEYDYAVTNLAVDLRDGLKLTRVMELLTQNWSLSYKLRVPTVSRLQKVHNVGVALDEMAEEGLDVRTVEGGKLDSRDIVDGHREKTLQLLWRIIFHFQVQQLLNEAQLREEIKFLKGNLKLQTQLALLVEDQVELAEMEERRRSLGIDLYFKSPTLSLLLRWCRAVCAYYDMKLENFTVSFSDGRALCYLVHHYHPALLPLDLIQTRTTLTYAGEDNSDCSASDSDDSFFGNWTQNFSPTTGKPSIRDELLANERSNFKVLYEKVLELSGIPLMVRCADMSNTIPDEKVVITYVSYLCARLLDIRQETRAARVIQVAWRRYWVHRRVRGQKARREAACKIQRVVRTWLLRRREARYYTATVTVQCWWRRVIACRLVARLRQHRDHCLQNQAATLLQRCVRRYLTRLQHQKRHQAATVLQNRWRCHQARHRFLATKRAACILQVHYRAYKLAQHQRRQYQWQRQAAVVLQMAWKAVQARRALKKHRAVILIQAAYRGHRERQSFLHKKAAAVTIQAFVRMVAQRQRYQQLCSATTTIQRCFRSMFAARQQRAEFLNLKVAVLMVQRLYRWKLGMRLAMQTTAATMIQATYRGYQERQRFLALKKAATVIQGRYRAWQEMLIEYRKYHIYRGAALTLQSWYRVHRAVEEYKQLRCSAIKVQALVRGHQARSRYLHLRKSAVTIQQCYRRHRQHKLQNQAATKIQSTFRGWQRKREFTAMKQAVTGLQAHFRGHRARMDLLRRKAATLILQSHFKATIQRNKTRREFLKTRNATVVLQAACRGWSARKGVRRTRATIQIQAVVRGLQARRHFQRVRAAVVAIQSYARMWQAQRQLREYKRAATIIQRRWRATLEMRRQQKVYTCQRSAAVCIQSVVRGFQARQRFTTQRTGFCKLQAFLRGRIQRRCYLSLKEAAITIQKKWRATVQTRSCQGEFMVKKQAVIHIQAAVRGYQTRRDFAKMKRGFTNLQAVVRSMQQRARYLQMKRAAVTLQKYWRARSLAVSIRQGYLVQKVAAVQIQALYRGHQARKQVQRIRAATRIQAALKGYRTRRAYHMYRFTVILTQSVVRGFLTRRRLSHQVAAAKVIQCRWRSTLLAKTCQQEYQLQKRAAITIQSCVRTLLARRRYNTMRAGFVRLQAITKGNIQRQEYLRQKSAAGTIQTRWRAALLGRQQRQEYTELRKSATTIQAAFRWYLLRQRLKAIIRLQAAIRGYICRRRYTAIHRAAVVLQAHARGRHCRLQYQRLQWAALTLQHHYRAHRQTQQAVQTYRCTHKAIVTIQTAIRGYRARQELRRRKAVLCVQTHFRALMARRRVQRLRAVVCIQSYYRGYQARQELKRRKAAVCIQKTYRGYRARRNIRWMHVAALIIQTTVRTHLAQKHFARQREAVLVIQRRWRALVFATTVRVSYLIIRASLVRLQAMIKGHQQRQRFLKMKRCAVTIQAAFRGHRQCQRYNTMRTAAVCIQQHWRAHQLMTSQRTEYQRLQQATVCIQSTYRGMQDRRLAHQMRAARRIQASIRGHIQRKCFLEQRQAVVRIQTCYRCYSQRVKYAAMKDAAVAIQRRWRALLLMRQTQMELVRKHAAVTIIQTVYRGHIQRRCFLEQRQAAVRIQTCYRCHSQTVKYTAMKAAAVAIQRRWRALLLMRQTQMELIRKHAAVTIIQTVYRGHIQRRCFLEQRQAAVRIQTCYRCHSQRVKYAAMKDAAITIQRRWRALLLMRQTQMELMKRHAAVTIIQTVYRGHIQRRCFLEQRQAAVRIQTCYRCHSQRVKYAAMRAAAVAIQRRWRALLLMRQTQMELVRKHAAVTIIQTIYRGHIQRKRFLEQRQAAVRIQTCYRCHSQRVKYAAMKDAAVAIQRRWRALLLMRQTQMELIRKHAAVTIIQTVYRGMLVRRWYRQQKESIVKLQSLVRGRQSRQRYLALRSAALVVQARWRATLQAREAHSVYQLQRVSAIKIQAAFRGYVQHKRYSTLRRGMIRLQARARGRMGRRRYDALRGAALIVQSQYRAVAAAKLQLQQYQQLRSAIITLQSAYRGRKTRLHLQRVEAVTRIQAAYRMRQERCKFLAQKRASILIQAQIRGHQARQRYIRLRCATLVLQSHVRAHLQRRAAQREFAQKRQAVLTLQAHCRGYLARRKLHQLRAAIRIQAAVRGYIQRRQFCCQRQAVVTLQCHVRRWLTLRWYQQLKRQHQAATCIQRRYRQHRQQLAVQERERRRAVYLQHVSTVTYRHLCVIRIQRTYRRHLAVEFAKQRLQSVLIIQHWLKAKLQRVRYLRLLCSVRALQAVSRVWLQRRHLAATLLQVAVRRWLDRRHAEKREQAATLIKAVWRGYQVRKRSKNRKVAQARRRLAEATKNATHEKKLGNRTTTALDFLLRYKQLAYILDALMHLDAATRLSPRCCERIVEGNAVSVIYRLIRSCNRSLPHIEIIKLSISILLNLAKYEKTLAGVYEVDGCIDTLLELLQIYREKGGAVFTRTCTLLGILGQDPDRREDIVSGPKVVDKLRSTYSLVLRKHKMEEKRMATKIKVDASRSFCGSQSFLAGQSFCVGPKPRGPRIRPDWVLRRDSVKEIQEPLPAIKFALNGLHIVPK